MSEAVSSKQSTAAGGHWLDLTKRILVGILMVLAAVGLIVNMAGLVGVWIAHGPARSDVTNVAGRMTHALGTVDNGLTRVNTLVQDAQTTVTQVNNEAAQLSDRIETNSLVAAKINQLVDNNLAPRIENVGTNASAIRDAFVTFNSVVAVVSRLPGVNESPLDAKLSSVSDRAQEARAAVQDLRTTLAEAKGGLVTKAAVVTQVTARINTALAQIQAIVNKYQAKVADKQARVTSASNRILTLINLLAVSLTILFIIFALGLVLLIWVCWQYVRTGHFPSLRVVRPS